MKYFIYIVLMSIVSCSVLKTSESPGSIHKLTFEVESIVDEIPEMTNDLKSYLKTIDSSLVSDSFSIVVQRMLKEKFERESKYPNELYIEVFNDGWARQRYTENRYTNFLMYNTKTDSVTLLSQDKTSHLRTFLFERDSCRYDIKIDESKTKTIHGFECHFVRLEEFAGDLKFLEIVGSTVYEMWVTTKINIPPYAVLNNECDVSGFFPLETKEYQSNTKGNYHITKLANIEYR